jgi:Ca2+-binding EF-hand superfamily protein
MVARLMHQLLETLDCCHSRGLVHNGVSPWNILLSAPGANGVHDCKLATYKFRAVPKAAAGSTTPYLAPEVARGSRQCSGRTPKADIWALGVVAFELLTGVAPFGRPAHHGGDPEPVLARIRRYVDFGELEDTIRRRRLSAEARDFLRYLLTVDPESRPAADAAAKHAWLRRHWTAPSGIDRDTLQSLAGFSTAAELERRCILAIAAGTDREDLRSYREMFLEMDGDNDGHLSASDFEAALRRSRGWWLPQLDPQAVFRAMDVDKKGSVVFAEFAAACVHGQLAPLDGWLADEAFDTLDRDKDGLLRTQDVAPFFRGQMPRGLPQGRPVQRSEWRALLVAECAGGSSMPSRDNASCGGAVVPLSPKASRNQFCTFLGLDRFFRGCAVPPLAGPADEFRFAADSSLAYPHWQRGGDASTSGLASNRKAFKAAVHAHTFERDAWKSQIERESERHSTHDPCARINSSSPTYVAAH